MDGQDDRFATPGAKPPQDAGFGFFAGPAPQAPAQGQFGSAAPAAAQAPAVFGAPASPYAPVSAPEPTRTGTSRTLIVAAIAVVVVVIGGGTLGWNVWKQHQDIGIPATLGGLAQNHDPAAEQAMASSVAALKKENPGKKAIAMSYGDPRSSFVVLVGIRGHVASFQKDFEQGGATGARQQIGHNTCAKALLGFMCERTSGHLTEGLFAASRTRTVAQASSMLDEAWAKS